MSKTILYKDEAWDKLKAGVNKLADAVEVTLGPGGSNVILERQVNHQITKDGVTVARDISFDDPTENMGASIVKEAANKTAELAGDGTTTATILARGIFNAGVKNVTAGANRMDLKKGIDIAVKAVVGELKKISKPVEPGDLLRIATISANGDADVAKLIDDAVSKVGKDGLISVEDNKGADSYTKIVEGTSFDRGYLSPNFVTDGEKMEVDFRNAEVLIYDGVIENMKELIPILDKRQQRGIIFPLLIIAEDVQGVVIATLAQNVRVQNIPFCAVQSPDFGDSRKESLKDFAALTGATIISRESGISLQKAELTCLGRADKIRVTQWNTFIIGGKGDKAAVKGRVNTINQQMKDATNPDALIALKNRYARIEAGVAVIYVGGNTDVEVREKKDRIDDALQATRAALDEGIVIGGGMALIKARQGLQAMEFSNKDIATGYYVLLDCLEIPLKTIAKNAEQNGDVVLNKIESGFSDGKKSAHFIANFGFNARTLQYEDLIKAGVIDPTKVTRLALENAASVAGMLLSTKAVIYNTRFIPK